MGAQVVPVVASSGTDESSGLTLRAPRRPFGITALTGETVR